MFSNIEIFVYIFAYLSNFKEINMKKKIQRKPKKKNINAYLYRQLGIISSPLGKTYVLSFGKSPFICSKLYKEKRLVNAISHTKCHNS